MIRGLPFHPITEIFFEGTRNADTGEMQSLHGQVMSQHASVGSSLGLKHTHTHVCLRSLCSVFSRFFRCVYGGGGIFLEQATLQGRWTHLSTLLVMKEPKPGAQQAVSCIEAQPSWEKP